MARARDKEGAKISKDLSDVGWGVGSLNPCLIKEEETREVFPKKETEVSKKRVLSSTMTVPRKNVALFFS